MSGSRNAGFIAGVFLIFLSLLYVRFGFWLPQVWYGDDLRDFYASVDGQFVHSWASAFTTTFASKWRPIFSLFMWLEYSNFKTYIGYYQFVNLVIGAASVSIFFFLAEMLSGSRFVASGLSLLMVWSRFATYQMTQVNGPIESLPLLFTLVAVYCVALAELGERLTQDDERKRVWLIGAAILFLGLAAYTHERYLVALPVMALYLWAAGGLKLADRIGGTLCIIFLIAFNVIAKVFVLKIEFFLGTGGQNIGFNIGVLLQNVLEALSSAVWFNYGPQYLVGVTTLSLPLIFVILAGACAAAIACLAVFGLVGAVIERANWVFPVFVMALAGALLVPAIALFRFEQRWLFTTFVLGLLFLAWCARHNISQVLIRLLLVILVCSALVVENRLAFAAERLFFLTGSMRVAEDARKLVDGTTGPIVIEGVDASVCGWVLSGGLFFRMYQGAKRDLYCVNSVGAYPSKPPDEAQRFTHSWGGFQAKKP